MPAKIYLPAKQSKYRAKPARVEEQHFASQREAQRAWELGLLFKAGKITGFRTQVPFSIDINGVHVCKYIADFVYWDGSEFIVEDTKGFRTKEYKLKKKLMWACHGILIKEI